VLVLDASEIEYDSSHLAIGVVLPASLFVQLVPLVGVEGVFSALAKCQLFFVVLLSVLESSIGHSSMLKSCCCAPDDDAPYGSNESLA
jgi:hypothetical protein